MGLFDRIAGWMRCGSPRKGLGVEELARRLGMSVEHFRAIRTASHQVITS